MDLQLPKGLKQLKLRLLLLMLASISTNPAESNVRRSASALGDRRRYGGL